MVFVRPYPQGVYFIWQHVAVVGHWQGYWDLGSWVALCFFPSKIWPTSGGVSKHQDEWVSLLSRTLQTGLSQLVKFYYRITVQLHLIVNTYEPLAGTLRCLCSVEISILVVVVWDLIFITLFLAAVKFHFHQLCFLSEKKSLRKYSKHCSQQSSQIWIIFNSQEDSPSPTVLHHSTFPKMTVFGHDTLIWEKEKDRVHSSFFPLYGFAQAVHSASTIGLSESHKRIHSFIQHTYQFWGPVIAGRGSCKCVRNEPGRHEGMLIIAGSGTIVWHGENVLQGKVFQKRKHLKVAL